MRDSRGSSDSRGMATVELHVGCHKLMAAAGDALVHVLREWGGEGGGGAAPPSADLDVQRGCTGGAAHGMGVGQGDAAAEYQRHGGAAEYQRHGGAAEYQRHGWAGVACDSLPAAAAAGCQMVVSMAAVAHYHAPLLTQLARTLQGLSLPCSRGSGHCGVGPQAVDGGMTSQGDRAPSWCWYDSGKGSGAPGGSAGALLLPLIGDAALAHTAAAYVRLGADDAGSVCWLVLQVCVVCAKGGGG